MALAAGLVIGYVARSHPACIQNDMQPMHYEVGTERLELEPRVLEADTYTFNIDLQEQRAQFNFAGEELCSLYLIGLVDDQGRSYNATETQQLIIPRFSGATPQIRVEAIPLGRHQGLDLYDIVSLEFDGRKYTRYGID